MARRRRYGAKRKGGRRSRSIPILETAYVVYPFAKAFKEQGLTVGAFDVGQWNLTGYELQSGKWQDPKKAVITAVALLAMSTIGRKVANRTGVNRIVKKATAGMATLV